MAEKQLSGIKVAILVTDGVEQVELLEPKKALEEAGAEVKVIAPRSGKSRDLNITTRPTRFQWIWNSIKRILKISMLCNYRAV